MQKKKRKIDSSIIASFVCWGVRALPLEVLCKFHEKPKSRRGGRGWGGGGGAGHLTQTKIFFSNAPLQGNCEWPNEAPNVIGNLLESSLMWSKVPITGPDNWSQIPQTRPLYPHTAISSAPQPGRNRIGRGHDYSNFKIYVKCVIVWIVGLSRLRGFSLDTKRSTSHERNLCLSCRLIF